MTGALDKPIHITLFPDLAATERESLFVSLTEFAELLRNERAPCKAALRLFSMCSYGGKRTSKRSLRHDTNIREMFAVIGDYDGGKVSLADATEALRRAGVCALLVTTPSYTPEFPRWRVICPLSDPLNCARANATGFELAAYGKLVSRLAGVFPETLAGESWTRSQAWYLGAVEGATVHGTLAIEDGAWIDQLPTLDATARPKPSPPVKPRAKRISQIGATPIPESETLFPEAALPLDIEGALAAITAGEGSHDALVRLAGKFAAQGLPESTAIAMLTYATGQRPVEQQDEGWRKMRAGIGRTVRWAFEKEAEAAQAAMHQAGNGAAATAPGVSPPPQPGTRPVIRITEGELERLADEAEAALIIAHADIYQRGTLVRPAITELPAADGGKTHAAAIHPINAYGLLDAFCRSAQWVKRGRRGWVAADPPLAVAHILRQRAGQWRLAPLRGVLTTPTLRPDGSLLNTQGYDPASAYYLWLPPDLVVPAISDEPEKSECAAALQLLDKLLDEFPFVSDAARSVGLSLILTAIVRAAMPVAPIHAASSPAPGTGKSFLFDIAAAIANGDRCPVIFAGNGPEELEKKLNGELLRGVALFNLDNLNHPLGGDLLCQAAERPLLDLRRLGSSDVIKSLNSALVGANGNNLVVHGDLTRRVVESGMDAEVERPELRRFKADPMAAIRADRGRYVAAVLTIVRGYLTDPAAEDPYPVASYGGWTHFVRGPLVWLGRADPANTMVGLRQADPVVTELLALMAAWQLAVGLNHPIAAAAIIRNIETPPLPDRNEYPDPSQWVAACNDTRARWADFSAIVNTSCGHHGRASSREVGDWLRLHQNRIAGDRKFAGTPGHGGLMQWRLVAA